MIGRQYFGAHALIITRQSDLAAHMAESLGLMGFITYNAATYAEISDYLNQYRPSLIVANLKTPRIRVWDVLSKARGQHLMGDHIPAVITVVYDEDSDDYYRPQFEAMVQNIMAMHQAAYSTV